MTTGATVKRQVGDDPLNQGGRHENDFYRTGEKGTLALLRAESFPGIVWEPACGEGDMAAVLAADPRIDRVIASDLYEREWKFPECSVALDGEQRRVEPIWGIDFLNSDNVFNAVHVVTNPPFRLDNRRGKDAIAAFAQHGLQVVPDGGKVALLGRLAWLEGVTRKHEVFDVMPPTRCWVFSFRCPMTRGSGGTMQTGLVAFAWYVWQKGMIGHATKLGWL
jgi:hypothetical protein